MSLVACYTILVGLSASFLVLGGVLVTGEHLLAGIVAITLGAGWLAILFGGLIRLLMACRPPLEEGEEDDETAI